jgi:hypothetical protein
MSGIIKRPDNVVELTPLGVVGSSWVRAVAVKWFPREFFEESEKKRWELFKYRV